jgi:hypothetical protein
MPDDTVATLHGATRRLPRPNSDVPHMLTDAAEDTRFLLDYVQ